MSWDRMSAAAALVLGLSAGPSACDGPAGPVDISESIALVRVRGNVELNATHQLLVIGLQSQRAVGWSPPLMFRIVRVALSPDGTRLFATGYGRGGWTESQIAIVDTRSLEVTRREFFADSTGYRRDRFGGLAIGGSGELAVSPDGRSLFIGSTQQEVSEEWGVAVVDAETFEPLGFIGPYPKRNMSLAVIPPGDFSTAGAIAVTTEPRSGWPNVGSTMKFFDPVTLEVLDSVDVSAALADESDGIVQIVPALDGRALYLWAASGWLLKYDLLGGRVIARVWSAAPFQSDLTISPEGNRLYLPHRWTHDSPSSGIISVYDADLNELPPIDLSGIQIRDLNSRVTHPPALNSVVEAPDGTLLVASGAMLAQLWGFQSGRVFFLDPVRHEIRNVVRLEGEISALDVLLPYAVFDARLGIDGAHTGHPAHPTGGGPRGGARGGRQWLRQHPPGWIYRSDASVMFDRMVIQTTSGAVGNGLVGPVESPNNIAQGDAVQAAKIAALPADITGSHTLPPMSVAVGEAKTVDDIDGAVEVQTDNPTAVSVALNDGEVTVTGRRIGSAGVTIVANDGALSTFTVTVQPADGPGLGAYLGKDGFPLRQGSR